MHREGHAASGSHVLGFMASLKAARDWGLDREAADAIALRFDSRADSFDHLVDDLADALLERGVVKVPNGA